MKSIQTYGFCMGFVRVLYGFCMVFKSKTGFSVGKPVFGKPQAQNQVFCSHPLFLKGSWSRGLGPKCRAARPFAGRRASEDSGAPDDAPSVPRGFWPLPHAEYDI